MSRGRRKAAWLALGLLGLGRLAGAGPAAQGLASAGPWAGVQRATAAPEAVPEPAGEAPARARLRFRDRPSLRLGELLRLDLRIKIHGDVTGFRPRLDPAANRFRFTRRRVGLEGTLARRIAFQVERELDRHERWPWRDVFVDLHLARRLDLRAGKFKMPFSLEQLTGATDLDFVHRSFVATTLAPGRARGLMAHGRFRGRALAYEVGWFDRDGELARRGDAPGGGRTWAARLLTDAGVDGLQIGGALTTARLPEGRNGLQGKSVASGYEFFERVYVAGRRLRWGGEASWRRGPFSVKGELAAVVDDRRGQGLGDEDLPPAVARGWFASGTWLLTGEAKRGDVAPRRPFPHRGPGAIELAVRLEEVVFGSRRAADPAEPFFANPRAANLLPNRVWALTPGVSWYANRWVRLQFNGTREHFHDPDRTPLWGRQVLWSWVLRMQVVL